MGKYFKKFIFIWIRKYELKILFLYEQKYDLDSPESPILIFKCRYRLHYLLYLIIYKYLEDLGDRLKNS